MVMTGWMWILLTVVGVAALGGAIAYGMIVSQRRRADPRAQARTEAATDRLYKEESRRESQ
jgi:hypothetical protein